MSTTANTSNLKNAISKSPEKKPPTIQEWIESKRGMIEQALPSIVTVDRMLSIASSALKNNPKLASCSSGSLMAGLIEASQLGLEVNTPLGLAYLIPYKNKGVMEAQFQIGYQGMLELAYRTNKFSEIYVEEVYENDEFSYILGLNRNIVHIPKTNGDRGKIIGWYGVYKLINGGFNFVYSTENQMESFAKEHSVPYKMGYNTPWKTNFSAMAKKTVLKMLLKYAPKSADMVKANQFDGTIKRQIHKDMELISDVTETIEVTEVVDKGTGEVLDGGLIE